MGWIILIVVAYLPIFYRIHMRIKNLEDQVRQLKDSQDTSMIEGAL